MLVNNPMPVDDLWPKNVSPKKPYSDQVKVQGNITTQGRGNASFDAYAASHHKQRTSVDKMGVGDTTGAAASAVLNSGAGPADYPNTYGITNKKITS